MAYEGAGVYEDAIKGYLQPIWHLLQDEKVTEVMINGHQEVFIEVDGKLQKSDSQFVDEDSLRAAITNIAQSVGRRIDFENPRLDARLPNGYRIHAVIPPMCKGTTVAIRKFSSVKLTFKDYIRFGTLSSETALFLDICMKLGKNILVSGGTGSGKTTLLSVLCNKIPPGQRVIVIEDSAELQIDYEHTVFFETRMADSQGKGEVTMEDLLKSSLRLRPDRIIVGEVRGAEALDLIQAMSTGHKGCLGTVHANSEEDAIVRLEALAQGAENQLSEKALQYQIGAAIDLVVQISRMADGSRRITGISEVLGSNQDGSYNVQSIFKMSRLEKLPNGKIKGALLPQNYIPSFMHEIEDHRLPFQRDQFRRRQKAS
ncbi:MAG: CpaF family protein [Bdellovibrionales bacterium]